MERDEHSLLLAGDSLITRPWSHVNDGPFLKLIDIVRSADVSITNLETVIHEFRGYAQAHGGGTYMASPPQIASELKWAGFDMVAHANNHSFDYGSTGVLETIEHVEQAGLILAGSGKDLQSARAPRYLRRRGICVALVAMASDFIPYGKASYSRPDLHGRPGLNPLTRGKKKPTLAENVQRILQFGIAKLGVGIDTDLVLGRKGQIDVADLTGNLIAVSEAASNADIVVVSVHAHKQGPWLAKFAREAIGRGADVIFVHGPHDTRGIEFFNRRPIFYSLGDFVFETEYIARFPAEAFESCGLAADQPLTDVTRSKLGSPMSRKRETFQGAATLIHFEGKSVARVRLVPVDLQFDCGGEQRGRPQLACPELGCKIIGKIAAKSQPLGTRIIYDSLANCGEVVLA